MGRALLVLFAMVGVTGCVPEVALDDDSVAGDDDTAGDDDLTDDDDATGDDDVTGDDDATSDDDVTGDDDTSEDPCGDGLPDPGEDCDDGAANGATDCGCQPDCSYGAMGNGCDDGDPCTGDGQCDGVGSCETGAPVDCGDGDPCTVDSCDPADGSCLNETYLPADVFELYDMALLTDPSTLVLDVVSSQIVWEGLTPVTVDEVRFTSYESEGCELLPVRIEAYIAYPPGANPGSPGPGVVVAHGLGGYADAGTAAGPAADLDLVTLAYSGPGQGQSEGWGSEPDHLFDTVDDPRNSWFWEHAVAAMRGLTVLETLAEVDPGQLGMTGYSGGAVATLMVNGVDPRVQVAVPVSGTGHLDLAISAVPVPGWEYDLLQSMTVPKTAADPEWTRYQDYLDPKNYLATAHGETLLINGAQDQFFPIDSLTATYQDLAGSAPRMLAIVDWDHGWYALFNGDEAVEATADALSYWFAHHFGLDNDLGELAPMPQVDVLMPWICLFDGWYPHNCSWAQVSLSAPTGYDVERVTLHFSVDGSLTYFSQDLEPSGNAWSGEVELLDGTLYDENNTVFFVEVEFAAGFLGWTRFRMTSEPNIPPGFSPNIIPIAGPLP